MKKHGLLILVVMHLVVLFSCQNNNADNIHQKTSGSSASGNEFSVLTYEPSGVLPAGVKYPSVFIQFSKPVVALQKLGEVMTSSQVMSIDPPLEGVFRWYGTSLLCFESSEEIIPQMEYTVKIQEKLVSIDGEMLKGLNSFTFKTQELSLLSIIPGYEAQKNGAFVDDRDVPLDLASDIALVFSYPVNPSVIKEYIEIRDQNRNYTFSVKAAADKVLQLSVKDAFEEDSTIAVVLKAGARSEKNYSGTASDQSYTFGTLKPLVNTAVHSELRSYGKYSNPVRIIYSHELSKDLEDSIYTGFSTNPPMTITKDNIEVRGSTITVYGLPVTFEQDYELMFSGLITDVYGRSLDDAVSVSVHVPAAESYAGFKNYGFALLESQFHPKLAFEYQNILPGSYYMINDTMTEYDEAAIPKNTRMFETIDILPYLQKVGKENFGYAVFYADIASEYKIDNEKKTQHIKNTQYVQVTDIGASVRYAYNKILILVSSLTTGEPLPNAVVSAVRVPYKTPYNDILSRSSGAVIAQGMTNSEGFLEIPLGARVYKNNFSNNETLYVDIETNNDRLIFNPNILSMYRYDVGRIASPQSAQDYLMQTFMFTDRGLYKPGETMTYRGIDRNLVEGVYESYSGPYTLQITTSDWRPVVLDTITGSTTATGGFWGRYTIPQDLKPGTYTISYSRMVNNREEKRTHSFTVAYFERLRFESSVSIPPVSYYRGSRVDAQIKASYLGGGSLANSTYKASWFSEPCGFKPAGEEFSDFRFGPLLGYEGRSFIGSTEGVLSMDGTASVSQNTGDEKILGMAYNYRVEARVTDAGSQEISASSSVVVHPAQFYIGIKKEGSSYGFAKKGESVSYAYVLVKPDGKKAEESLFSEKNKKAALIVELEKEEWKRVNQVGVSGQINTRYVRQMAGEASFEIDCEQQGKFSITPQSGGVYLLRVSTKDSGKNEVISEQRFYATGSSYYSYGSADAQEIQLITDKALYNTGDTAQILLQSPLPRGRYLVSVEREGIFSHNIITLEDSVSVIEIPVKEEYLPVVYVSVSSYSLRTGSPAPDYATPDVNKPKGYFGVCALHVNPESRSFVIEIDKDKESYRPGEKAKLTLTAVKDGKPVPNAEITFMAVDRGVIDLINYHVPSPLEYFYNEWNFRYCIRGGDSRSLLIDPVTYEVKNLFGGDSDEDDKLNERKNFDPTAYFEPYLLTDSQGRVSFEFTLPDSLTEYRLTAVGVSSNDFALAEEKMAVNNPLSVREVLPRRLRVHDVSEAGVVVSNLDSIDHEVSVSLKTYEGIERTGLPSVQNGINKEKGILAAKNETVKKITVPANQTASLFFSIEAQESGFASLEFTVNSSVINERIIKPLEIEKSYMYETVTTVGQIDGDEKDTVSQKELIVIPGSAEDNKGSLYVQLDPTRLGVLREAVQYVFNYPYGCLEQRSAAILPMLYFAEYLEIFDLERKVTDPGAVIKKELEYWASCQKADGGFPYWPSGLRSDFPVTLRIGEILGSAQQKGIKIPGGIDIKKLCDYIYASQAEYAQKSLYNSSYVRSYSYYVLGLLGREVPALDLEALLTSDDAGISDLAFTGLSYLLKGKVNKAKEAAQKIRKYMKPDVRGMDLQSVHGNWTMWGFYNNKTENYALVLKLLTLINKDDKFIGNLVYELLEFQKAGNGYWTSTAATARVLDALDTYIREKDLQNLSYTAEVLLGDKQIMKNSFEGLNASISERTMLFNEEPLKKLSRDEELPLEITKQGYGSLFYTLSLKYALSAEEQTPRDEGICVFTEYTDIETGERVTENVLVSGRVYRAKVILSSTRLRTFMAVRVPIPSGAEVLNAAFVTTGSFAEFESDDDTPASDIGFGEKTYADYNAGLSYQAIYDNEVQYFWNYFPQGRQQVEFLFRAVRKGLYETPSSLAECMYESEIFGRSGGKKIEIK
ncbi:MAG: hypothetical protein KA785_04085 [Spirochaetaceae bacterium]|nr:hypothetical protein [Spirochaetaceae bacterium]